MTNWSPASTRRSCRAPPPNSSPPNSPSARSGTGAPGSRAIWSSPTSRTARAACATCTRCSGLRSTSTACARPTNWSSAACSTRRNTAPSAAAPIPVVGPLQPAFLSGRAEERLSFDLQREIAVRLGYTSHPGMQDVERFMKHYFLIAKDVGDLTAILCAKLEDEQAKPAPVLSRMVARLRPGAKRRRVPDSDDFIIDNNRINLAAPDVFKHDPVNLIRIFQLAQKNNLAFHPDAMRTVTRSLKLVNAQLRENPEANRLFMEILTSNNAEIVLRRMNETGVLGHFIRAFGKIVSMMQFNMYHHYTVDEHLIRCIGHLQEIERGGNDEFVVASDLFRKIRPEHRAVIYITTLLHDVAKGRPGGSFDRRRQGGAAAMPAARLQRRRYRTGGLADRRASHDVHGRAVARPFRPQDDREFRRRGAVGRADEAADDPDHRRHPRRRPRRVERLEGAVVAHALLRDRAGADRRLLGSEPRAAHRGGASRIPRRLHRMAGSRTQRLYRPALSGLLAQGRAAAQDPPCALHPRQRAGRPQARDQCRLRRGARRHRTDDSGDRPSVAVVDHRGRLRLRRRQHRRRADLHHHRRPRARHHRDLKGIRPRRGRGTARDPDRRDDRAGAGRQAAAARSGGPQGAPAAARCAPSWSSRK